MVMRRLAGTMSIAGGGLHGYAGLGERRNKIAHRFVDGELAFFHQGQHGRARERFGLRRDTEDGVRGHLAPGFLVSPTEGAFVCRLAVLEHESDDPGDAVIVDVFLQDTIDALETWRRIWRDRISATAARVRQ